MLSNVVWWRKVRFRCAVEGITENASMEWTNDNNCYHIQKKFTLEFFKNSPQYKKANIANFVLAMPLEKK